MNTPGELQYIYTHTQKYKKQCKRTVYKKHNKNFDT